MHFSIHLIFTDPIMKGQQTFHPQILKNLSHYIKVYFKNQHVNKKNLKKSYPQSPSLWIIIIL